MNVCISFGDMFREICVHIFSVVVSFHQNSLHRLSGFPNKLHIPMMRLNQMKGLVLTGCYAGAKTPARNES